MTEQEWLACTDPQPMLEFVRGKVSDRKLRLFACACCRSVWHILADERSRSGLEAAEYYADSLGSLAEQREVRAGCMRAMEDASGDSESAALGHAKWYAATAVVCCTEIPLAWDSARDACQEARQAQSCYLFEVVNQGVEVPFPEPEPTDGLAYSEFLYDIFGNPFRPISLDPTWLTWQDGTIPKVAQTIYDDRAFHHLPVLADNLEEAGCDNADLLNHCRGPGPHVRGCWVVDLLLGKG